MAFAILSARKQFLMKRKNDISLQLMQISQERQTVSAITGDASQKVAEASMMASMFSGNQTSGAMISMLGSSVVQNMTNAIDSPLEQKQGQLQTEYNAIDAELKSVEEQEKKEAERQFKIFG